jgi:hypothetical protein
MQLTAQDVFYVNVLGDDSNPGTEALPWQSPNASKWTNGCTVKISGEIYAYETAEVMAKNVTLEGITPDAAIAALDDSEFEDPLTISGFQLFKVGDDMDEAALTIKNLTVKNVRREELNASGGMFFIGLLGTLNLDNAVIKNFESTIQSFGGAIQCAGKIYATNTVFDNNSCMYGGAVQIQESEEPVEGIFENCTFTNNKAGVYKDASGNPTTYSQGGAVSLQAIKRGNFLFNNCYFDNNQSLKHLGGAIVFSMVNTSDNTNITLKITNCTFTNNYSFQHGAAIAFNSQPLAGNVNFTLANSTFLNNTASNSNGTAFSILGGGPNSTPETTGKYVFANNTFFRNTRDTQSGYSAIFLYGQRGIDLYLANNIILEETWSGSQGLTVEGSFDPSLPLEERVPLHGYKSFVVKNNILGRCGGSTYPNFDGGTYLGREVENLENYNRQLTDAKDGIGWVIQPEDNAVIVGLATTLTTPETGVPYMPLTDSDGLAVNFGTNSMLVEGVNAVPQTDVRGYAYVGEFRDAGAYEFGASSAVSGATVQNGLYAYLFGNVLYLKDGAAAVTLYNAAGAPVLSAKKAASVTTAHLPAGIYLVKITNSEGKSFTQKVIKK